MAAKTIGKLTARSFGPHASGTGLRRARAEPIRAGRAGGLPFDSLVTDLFNGCLPATSVCYGECFAARAAFDGAGIDFGRRVRNRLDPEVLADDLSRIPTGQAFVRSGWNSDLSWGWNDADAVRILELVAAAGLHPVVLTKAFTVLQPGTMARLTSLGTELRVCVSAFDTDAQLAHRIRTMVSYRERGGLAVPVLMSTRFADSALAGRQDAVVQRLVDLDLPGAENSIRFAARSPTRPALDVNALARVAGGDDVWAGRLYPDLLRVPTLSSVPPSYAGVEPFASREAPGRLAALFADPVPTHQHLTAEGVAAKPRCAGVARKWVKPGEATRPVAIPEGTLRVRERAFLLRAGAPVARQIPRDKRERAAVEEYLALLASGDVSPLAPGRRYHDRVRELVAAAPPMAPSCRVAVNVPALAEERTVERLLVSYARQRGAEDWTWELNLLVNGPEGHAFDATERRARAFVEPYARRGIQLNVLRAELPEDAATAGLARRLLADFTLTRAAACSRRRGALYVKHEDADTAGHSPNLLASGLRRLDEDLGLDAVVHRISYDPALLRAHDGLRLERLVYLATERGFFRTMADLRSAACRLGEPMAMSDRKFRVLTSGFSTLCTAESVALLCGGFSSLGRSEDLQFGDKLALLRGVWDGAAIVPDPDTVAAWDASSWSDARRQVRNLERALTSGHLADDPYADFDNPQATMDLRHLDCAQRLAAEPLASVGDLRSTGDARLIAFTDLVLDFCSRLVVKTVPGREDEVMGRFCEFLSSLLGPGAVALDARRAVLGDVRALRASPALTRLPVF